MLVKPRPPLRVVPGKPDAVVRPGYRRQGTLLLAALALMGLLFLMGSQPALAQDASDYIFRFDDFSLSKSGEVTGIWSDGDTIWAGDFLADQIYAYDRLTGDVKDSEEFISQEFSNAGNDDPRGIWSDGTTMYVTDQTYDKVYAYKMSDKTRDSDKEFNLDFDNQSPTGLWSDGRTMWVAQDGGVPDVALFAYKLGAANANPPRTSPC